MTELDAFSGRSDTHHAAACYMCSYLADTGYIATVGLLILCESLGAFYVVIY